MKTANEMDACARKVLKRMAVFGLVYVLLILLGVLLLVGSYLWATRWGWYILLATISQIHSGAIIAIVLGLYVGVILLSLRSEEHTSELQSRQYLVCRLLLEKK